MKWRQQNGKPQKDGYYFIKEGDSGGGRYYFETIGGGQWRWHEYSNRVSERHKFEWLDESLPASIEQEAETLYPYPDKKPGIDNIEARDKADLQQQAHITCARQYMGEISTLKEVRDNLWKCFETEKNNHIHFANECEKLQAENSKMRKALEEIAQKYADAEVLDDIGQFVFEMGELATEALK